MTVQRARSTYTDNVTQVGGEPLSSAAGSLMQAPQAMLATATEAQRQMVSFMNMRLEKDRSTFRDASACRNMADVVHLQFNWMQETLRDYGEQTSRMLALYTAPGEQSEHRRER